MDMNDENFYKLVFFKSKQTNKPRELHKVIACLYAVHTGKNSKNLGKSNVTPTNIKLYINGNRNLKKLLNNLVKTIDKKHYGTPAVKIIEQIHDELTTENTNYFNITSNNDDFKNKVAQQLIVYGVDENKVKFKSKTCKDGLELLAAKILKKLREESKKIKKEGGSSNTEVIIKVKLPKTINKTDPNLACGIIGLLPLKFKSNAVLKVPCTSNIQINGNTVEVKAEVDSGFLKSDLAHEKKPTPQKPTRPAPKPR